MESSIFPSSSCCNYKKLFFLIILFISSFIHLSSQLSQSSSKSDEFIRSSCSTTRYPRLCYSSLSKHASSIQTNRFILTTTALNLTLASAKSTSAFISSVSLNGPGPNGLKPRVAAALRDCVEVLGDSVDELRRSVSELGRAEVRPNFEATMSDVETWVSSALTDENTCSDGFEEENGMDANVKTLVNSHILRLAQLTSNALAFINQFASQHA